MDKLGKFAKEVIRISEEDGTTEGYVILSSCAAHFPPDLDISLIITEQKTRWASGRSYRRGHMAKTDRSKQICSKFGRIAVFIEPIRTEKKMKKMGEVEDRNEIHDDATSNLLLQRLVFIPYVFCDGSWSWV